MAEGHDGRDGPGRSPSVSSSTQTWSPAPSPWMSDGQRDKDCGDPQTGMQTSELPSSHFYEELFCSSQAPGPLMPLSGALINSCSPQSDVVKQGYLGKEERNHRRYFVLRAGSHTGPSRLEWYKSEEKFTTVEKSAGKTVLFGSSKQGVIYLRCCLGVSRTGSTRKGHTVSVYAHDQTVVMVAEDQRRQDDWYLAIKKLMEEEQDDEEHGEVLDEEDDGYCTLPPAAFFKEVWPVSVKPKGLGRSKSLTGETRLCLTATSLILIRLATSSDSPSVTIPLLSVRRFGHLDGLFFLELGRSAPDGPGEIWMEARDQRIAQQIHEVVRETARTLKALPDFSRSPPSSHGLPQALLLSKRNRPKYREKMVNVRSPASLLAPRTADVQTSPTLCYPGPRKLDKTEPKSASGLTSHLSPFRRQHGPVPPAVGYMEMRRKPRSVAACRKETVELGEKEEEEPQEYMMMSPQASHSPSGLPQDDYETMVSPEKRHRPPFASSSSSSLQTSFNSSMSDSNSPVHPSHRQTYERPKPHWFVTSVQQSETETGQMKIGCTARPLDDDDDDDDADQEQKSVECMRVSAQAASPPAGSFNGSVLMPPFVTSGPIYTRPVQPGPNSGTSQCSRPEAAPEQSAARRCLLMFCLPFCLRAEDGAS